MKKILIVAGLLLLGVPAQAQFGNLLKKGKDAIESKIKKKTGKEDKGKTSQNKQSGASKTSASEMNDAEVMLSDEYYNGGEIPAWLRGLKTSNFHQCYNSTFPSAPEPAAGATTLLYGGSSCYYSPFSDGVAYLSSYEGENFFFDKKGNILFKTEMYESDDTHAPRFNNGVVMEVLDRRTPKCIARIRDKRGNVIKEFPKCYNATNFVDGIAAVHYSTQDGLLNTHDIVKYVDTSGKEVFPALTIDSWKGLGLKGLHTFVVRGSEGLTPFATIDKENGDKLWGFRDATGKIVVPAQYFSVCGFSEGLAAVQLCDDKRKRPSDHRKEGKWGYIDKSGKMVIPAIYTNKPSAFNSGLAVVTNKEDAAYYIDKTGATKYGPVSRWINTEDKKDGDFVTIGPFSNGYALVEFCSVDPSLYNNVSRYVGIIDPSFNILSWGGLGLPGYGGVFGAVYHDGKFYIPSEGSSDLYCMEVPDMKRTVREVRDLYIEGLSRYRSRNAGGHSGYMDENGRIVIEVKPTEF
ncbi:MAG: WG repeat-containing protein [Bacteroidales bacterium]|nr:WG repeat-containing protein [Bacteroidales bacterium]